MKRKATEKKREPVTSKALTDLYDFNFDEQPPEEYDWKRMLVIYDSMTGLAIRKAYYVVSKNYFITADGSGAGKTMLDVIGWVLDPKGEEKY